MLIKKRRAWDIPSSEITSETAWLNRRRFMALASGGAIAAGLPLSAGAEQKLEPLSFRKATDKMQAKGFYTGESLTPFDDVSHYNNFYEFGTGKTDPARHAPALLQTEPWRVKVTGHAEKTGEFNLEDILARFPLQERIYRLRCVEAWSMVIPWVGFPLADLIRWLQPTGKARYVAFETLLDPQQMPAQKSATAIIDWPYREGLRMDEAMNELTLLAVGLYGKQLPAQNGAPLRLVVPWKYGFKSIKSIVGIHFVEKQPATSWQSMAPHEYGFYANVNPDVSHPRWSQATERRLPSGLFSIGRQKTQMFNGYSEQVAHLYKGMDLSKHY